MIGDGRRGVMELESRPRGDDQDTKWVAGGALSDASEIAG